MKLGCLAVLPFLALAGCDMRPEHAQWAKECAHYETQTSVGVGTGVGSNGQVVTTVTPVTFSICTNYHIICIAGKDGSKCKGSPPALESLG
jgi:hypothetical protein